MTEWHHPVPKSRKGRDKVPVHPICHQAIHASFTNAQLERIALAVEQIRAKRDWGAALIGLVAALVAGWFFPHYFLLAASLMLVAVLLAWPLPGKGELVHDHD